MILIDFFPSFSWFHGSITSITCTLSDVRPNPEGADSKRESALRYKAGEKGRPEFLQNKKQDVKCFKFYDIRNICFLCVHFFPLPFPLFFPFMAALGTCSLGTRQVFVRLRRGVKQCANVSSLRVFQDFSFNISTCFIFFAWRNCLKITQKGSQNRPGSVVEIDLPCCSLLASNFQAMKLNFGQSTLHCSNSIWRKTLVGSATFESHKTGVWGTENLQ